MHADPWDRTQQPAARRPVRRVDDAARLSRPHVTAWLVAVALAGVVVPVATWLSAGPWPTLALPLLAAWVLWDVRRAWRDTRASLLRAAARAESATVRDELTGSSNEAGLRLLGSQLLHTARRHGDALHAFVVDVNDMGVINRVLSPEAGDEVLVAVAEAVRASVRGTDVVARGSGDEFVVIGPGSGVHPGELERRVRAFLVESPPAPLHVWPCRVTVGHATLTPWDSGDVDDVVARAYQDLHLRSALRAPSAPEPPIRIPGGGAA